MDPAPTERARAVGWSIDEHGRRLCPACVVADVHDLVRGVTIPTARRDVTFVLHVSCAISRVATSDRLRALRILDDAASGGPTEEALRGKLSVEHRRSRLPVTVTSMMPKASSLRFEAFDRELVALLAVRWSVTVHAPVRPTGRTLAALLRRQRIVARFGESAITFDVPGAEAAVEVTT